MKMPFSKPAIVAIAIIVLMLAGEAIVFTSGQAGYSSDANNNGYETSYSINCPGSRVYDVSVFDGSMAAPSHVYIYYDPSYESKYEEVSVAVGGRALDQQYYADQLEPTLKMRGIANISYVDAKGFLEVMNSYDCAVICISGALPATVYDGTEDSPVLEWIAKGGRLYWAGNEIGKFISSENGTNEVKNGTSLFLGSECTDPTDSKTLNVIGNGLKEALCLLNNDVRYGVDPSKLPEDSKHLELGYTEGTRTSICLVQHGAGMICVMGGDYSNFQRIDMAQIIASGISPGSILIEHINGSCRGHTEGTVAVGDYVYISIGGDFTVSAKLHEVKG